MFSSTTSVATLIDATKAWVAQPFRSTMSLWGWLLFVGVLAAGSVLWARVLAHIGE
jgi:hypothetical protein